MKKVTNITMLMLFLILFFSACKKEKQENISTSFFKQLTATQTGLTFENTIKEHPQLNHFFYNYIYNGGGVALGDINNDGLPDLFCTGNMVSDQLYLNKGNLQFEEITKSAGIVEDKFWSTGVTMADVNADGWLDIYVCRGGPFLKPYQRKNLLYINNKDNTFSEKGTDYGLDNKGYSTQAVFFDVDNDSDLDMYLANTPADVQVVLGMGLPKNVINEFESNRLYRNTGKNFFVDISKHAGIESYAYTLNVIASDVNNDGWVDLLATNDFEGSDFLFMNNHDLTFSNHADSLLKHISFNSMGSDIADFNNDGFKDLVVLDMAASDHFRAKTNMGSMSNETFWHNVNSGKHFQYMYNTLQLNNENGHFSEIAQVAGIAKTDWSWGALFADFDNDGWKDLLVTNGIKKDMRNNDILDAVRKTQSAGNQQLNWLQIVNETPSVPLPNYLFKNNGDFTFTNVAEKWGINQPNFSNGLAIADLDQDGDLDFITNNIDSPLGVYENKKGNQQNYIRLKLEENGANKLALNAQVQIHYNGQIQTQEITPTRAYLSASETIVHFGLGHQNDIDKVSIHWSDGQYSEYKNLAINQLHIIKKSEATFIQEEKNENVITLFEEVTNHIDLDYIHKENKFDDFIRETLLPHKQSQNGPYISNGDVNGDGLDDFYIGGAATYAGKLFLQKEDGQFKESSTTVFKTDKEKEDLTSLFFDADQDGDLDLYVVSGGNEFPINDVRYQDRLYLNNGKGSFTKVNNNLPANHESTQIVKASDIDQDGDLDLFIGGRLIPGAYPNPANSYLLLNENGQFKDITKAKAKGFEHLGMVTDAIFADYDGDQDEDLIIVGEWMNIEIFQNENGQFNSKTESLGLSDSRGWWWTIESGDFDNDGDVDFMLGNLGKNTKFKPSGEKPFKIFGNDFDKNGTNDIVLANYYKDEIVPVRGRECSSEQMPFIAQKFPSYESFAKASVEDIYSKEQLEQSIQYEIKSFESIFLRNDNGHFEKISLPIEAQFSPIRDFLIQDFDHDGNLDVLAVGNLHAAEVETMRYDAGVGILLQGDGKGHFKKNKKVDHEFFTPHDARSLITLKGKRNYIVVGNNQERVQFFLME